MSITPDIKPVNTTADNSFVHLVHFHATADFGEERNGQLATEMFPEVREPLQHQRRARKSHCRSLSCHKSKPSR